MNKFLTFCVALGLVAGCTSEKHNGNGGEGGGGEDKKTLVINVVTGEASEITPESALLSATYTTKNLNRDALACFFLSETGGTPAEICSRGTLIEAGPLPLEEADGSFCAVAEGLSPSTTYYFIAYVFTEEKEFTGDVGSFTTAVKPVASSATGEASEVTEISATLSGYAHPIEEMGTVSYGIFLSTESDPGADNSTRLTATALDENNKYSTQATGLLPGTTYYFRSFLQGGGTLLTGQVKQFSTVAISAQVTTLSAGDVGLFGATLGGRLASSSSLEKAAWFLLGSSGDLETLQASGTKIAATLQEDGTFIVERTGLSYNTTYYYVACASVHDQEFYGTPVSFKTKDFSASVTTGAATDVDLNTATLNGSLSTSEADTFSKSAWFLIGDSGDLATLKDSGAKRTSTLNTDGTFSYAQAGLDYNTTYYYVACAKVDTREVYGTPVSFKTKDIEASVTTVDASEISDDQATINGSVTVGSGLSISEVWFLWGDSDNLEALIAADRHISSTLRGDGTFIYTFRGRTPNSTTYYVACAKVGGRNFYGQVKDFTTTDKTIVDLGLSVRWRSVNIPLTDPRYPESSGSWISWGSVTMTYCNWANYCWANGSPTSLTKYNTLASYGKVDNKTVLDLEDDVAHAVLGGNWRMPTAEEWKELRENCTLSAKTINGKNGILVTGKNGNSIFLPCAGYMLDLERKNEGDDGYYWSSSLVTDAPSNAHHVFFFKNNTVINQPTGGGQRHFGMSVRPVTN